MVTKDVPDYALMMGNPARQEGWMSRHGQRLRKPAADGTLTCPETGLRYRVEGARLRCLDLDEDSPLPEKWTKGSKFYDEFRDGTSG